MGAVWGAELWVVGSGCGVMGGGQWAFGAMQWVLRNGC